MRTRAMSKARSVTRRSLLTGTISRGLDLLHTVCRTAEDHKNLVSTMQTNICHPAGFFLEDDVLGEPPQYIRRHERRCARDEKQLRRDPMHFRGDGEPDKHGLRPALARTLMWGEKYSNLCGYYVPDSIRGWGVCHLGRGAARTDRRERCFVPAVEGGEGDS